MEAKSNLEYGPSEVKCFGSDSSSIDCLSDARNRLSDELKRAYQESDNVLIESLPITGKTHSTFKQAAETNTSILYLANRNYQKRDAKEYCEKFGLDSWTIPTPHDTCPSFKGEYGEDKANELESLYKSGVYGRDLHQSGDLPCQEDGPCPYIAAFREDLDDYDVLIGHASHGYNPEYTEGRVVVKDEFSAGDYETHFGDSRPRDIVNQFLRNVSLPFDSYSEIIQAEQKEKSQADRWFEQAGLYRDVGNVLKGSGFHTLAPALTYGLLTATEVHEGVEKSEFVLTDLLNIDRESIGRDAIMVRVSENGETISLLNPPNFEQADGFIGLDGTPELDMWETATGLDLEHRQVLSDSEKQKYITDILNLDIIQLTDDKRSYHRRGKLPTATDTTIAYSIWQREGQKPGLITSDKAKRQYGDEIHEYISDLETFANVLSLTRFENEQVGMVAGMRNFGDSYIKKWAAYEGKSLEIDREGDGPTYKFGSETFEIFPLFQSLTLQDVFRFGRNEKRTTVYVNTCALPEWVPSRREDIQEYGKSKRVVLEELEPEEPKTVNELVQSLPISESTVKRKLSTLVEIGVVEKEAVPGPYPTEYRVCG